jgi:site-specific DNA recombinase
MLKREQVLCPTVYAYRKFGLTHTSLDLEHPREDCLVIESSHEPLVDRETWDIVQRVRQNKRRPTKMEEQNKYSGLVVCADCGRTMVLHRAHTMAVTYNHFTYQTYEKLGSEVCSAHYFRECILDEVVLEDLRRVTAQAREHTREFAEYISGRQTAEVHREIRRREKELTALNKRAGELDTIFKRLYEDSVLGHITAEQFQILSSSYTEERARFKEEIPAQEAAPAAPKKKFVCKICGYIYEGDSLPADFICPLCKRGAEFFEPMD